MLNVSENRENGELPSSIRIAQLPIQDPRFLDGPHPHVLCEHEDSVIRQWTDNAIKQTVNKCARVSGPCKEILIYVLNVLD